MEFTFDKLYLWLGFLKNVFSEENPYNLSNSEREELRALLEESKQTRSQAFYDGSMEGLKNENCICTKALP